MIRWDVAPSTYDGYCSQIKNTYSHAGPKFIKRIDTALVKKWVNQLKETLAPKTVREVVTRLAAIHDLWRQENKISYNPFETIILLNDWTTLNQIRLPKQKSP